MLFLFNTIFLNIKSFIIFKHNELMNNNLSLKEIKIEMKKSFLDTNTFLSYKIIKLIYQNIYYICYNSLLRLSFNDSYDNLNIESILAFQDLDMNELRTKTDKVIENNSNLYSGIIKWISGNCWLNSKLTNGYSDNLDTNDKEILYSINKTVELVEPMSKSLILFHGFEYFSNYREENLKVGYILIYPGILSKTTCFRVAKNFAQFQNYFQPKYLVIYYPKGSKHIGLDIKLPKYDEYEYISKSEEKFKIKKIYKRFNGIKLETFYICDSLNY